MPNTDLKTPILIEVSHALGIITLNRPGQLNALNLEMNRAMEAALTAWQTDDTIKAVIIQSSSDRAFCAGGDIKAVYEARDKPITEKIIFFQLEYQLNLMLAEYPKPIIAFCQGITMGGGCGIAFHVSHPIAGDHIRLAMPETRIGLFPDIGASYKLPRLQHHLGYYLGLTGESIQQASVIDCGLMRHGATSAQWQSLFIALQDLVWSDDAFKTVSEVLKAVEMKPSHQSSLMKNRSWIHALFDVPTIEALFRRCEAQCPKEESLWRLRMLEIMQKASPMSLKITLEAFKRGAHKSLAAVLQQDLGLAKKCLLNPDFYEGVRACLIDRNTPQWHIKDGHTITDDRVAHWFEIDGT